MSALNLYKSYNFVDKDPVIDLMRDIVKEQRTAYAKLSYESGVSEATLRAWFDGKTKRPQFATVAAVMSALGYRITWAQETGRQARQPANAASQMDKARQLLIAAHGHL